MEKTTESVDPYMDSVLFCRARAAVEVSLYRRHRKGMTTQLIVKWGHSNHAPR